MTNKRKKISKQFYSNPKTFGLIAFILMFSLIVVVVSLRHNIVSKNREKEMSNIINIVQENFQQILKTSYVSTLTMAMTINDNGETENFEEVASQILKNKSGIDAVQLVPNGIIKYVYPLKGNEKAINYNILTSSYNLKKEAEKSIERKEIYFAGPFALIQGGYGVVGRLPVYKKNKFWGFSAVLIRLETLVKSSGLQSIDESKYYFQLSKFNSTTNKEEFFLSNKSDFSKNYFQTVTIPEGDWKLYLISTRKNSILSELWSLIIFGLLLSVVSGLLVHYLLKRPAELKKLLKQKSRRLLISEKEYKALFDLAPIGIAKVITETGAFKEVNQELCAIVGYSEEELRELNFQKITYHEDLENGLENFHKLKNGLINDFSCEKRYITKTGEIVWVNLILAPLWREGEKRLNHIAIMEDITEKKIAEQNLKESFEIVSEQNKRLLNFSYIISHNLRSHTSNIETIADLLHQTEEKEEKDQLMGMLKQVSKSLNETMSNLNEVVNIKSNTNLKIEPLNLNQYIEHTIELTNDNLNSNKSIIINNVPKDTVVNFNISYLESVLYNFVSNAIKYSSSERDSKIILSFNSLTNILKIQDNGIGIDLNKNGDKLFGLYKTFNENPESKGVGLFIAKNQIQAMGGSITVESELNIGTTFSIYFK